MNLVCHIYMTVSFSTVATFEILLRLNPEMCLFLDLRNTPINL